MKKRSFYFLISLKKLAGILPVIFLVGAIVTLTCALLVSKTQKNADATIKVGICGETDNAYVKVGTVLLSETNTVELIKYEDKEDAINALKNMEIQGCAVIPDGFIKNALRGKNIPLQYYVLKKPASLSAELTNEVVQMMSPVVFNSQNAVFGAMDYLDATGNSDLSGDASEELSAKYILTLLQRDGFFETIDMGISHTPNLVSYYTVAIILLFVLVCGTVTAPKMIKKDMTLSSLLRWRGIGTPSQILCEWSSYSLIIYIFVVILTALLGQGAGFGISLLPSVLLITSMQFLLFELADSPVSGMMLHLFVSVILAYISGLLYPLYLLPEALKNFAAHLPVGRSFDLACKIFSGTDDLSDSLCVLMLAAVILIISILTRRIRMRGESI
ncbi:MAG: ABC transporter permease [Ruminococcaceae bacterium]|nr:ABC transporter permease [Oscillospiraceae bacterium]